MALSLSLTLNPSLIPLFALLLVGLFAKTLVLSITCVLVGAAIVDYLLIYKGQDPTSSILNAPLFFWHRLSDLLLLLSLASLSMTTWQGNANALLCGAIFIRSSSVFAFPRQMSLLQSTHPLTRVLYLLVAHQAPLWLLLKYPNLAPHRLFEFGFFVGLGALWLALAIIYGFAHWGQPTLRIVAGYTLNGLTFLLHLFDAPRAAMWLAAITCVISIPLLIHPRQFPKSTQRFLAKGHRADELLYVSWAKLIGLLSSFYNRITWPVLVFGAFVQAPAILSALARVVLRTLNLGGAQRAFATVLLGRLAFFVFYVEQ